MKTKLISKAIIASLSSMLLLATPVQASNSELNNMVYRYYKTNPTTNEQRIAWAAKDVVSRGKVTYKNVARLAQLVQLGYHCNQTDGPISITRGVYKTWMNSKNVYVVCLSGTDTDAKGQSTGIWTDLLTGFEFNNAYINNVRNTIVSHIPANSNIILYGHSLGGMVAQQAASDSTLKNRYNILSTVTFGSPVINGFSREGMVQRLGDTSDAIPYMSVTTFLNIGWQAAGLNRENGGYGSNLMNAHTQSYQREDVWGRYDITGHKGGSDQLTLDFSTTAFYHSPVKVTR